MHRLMNMTRTRVFGIGLSRTSTRSLTRALTELEHRCVHYPVDLKAIQRHDAATDITVACRYQQLDRMFPGSKFILTLRERAAWLESCRNHFAAPSRIRALNELSSRQRELRLDVRRLVYGSADFNAELFSAAYDRHADGVREYFRDRPTDLLEMDICAGDGWEKLCPFLGKPVPEMPFPHDCQWGQENQVLYDKPFAWLRRVKRKLTATVRNIGSRNAKQNVHSH